MLGELEGGFLLRCHYPCYYNKVANAMTFCPISCRTITCIHSNFEGWRINAIHGIGEAALRPNLARSNDTDTSFITTLLHFATFDLLP